MPDYIYLDIETIPAQNAAIRQRIADSVRPPANYAKPETIAKWEAENKPEAVEREIARTGLNGAFGHVCAIGFGFNAEPIGCEVAENVDDEAVILKRFVKALDFKRRDFGTPTIVGHNVAGFDIRFIWQRAFVLGIQLPEWFPRDPKPWSQDVFDTMTAWAGSRDTISLDNLCEAFGLPGKGDISGKDVAALWALKSFKQIGEYCMDDVERVRQIHWRMLPALGKLVPAPAPENSITSIDDEIPAFGSAA